MVGQVLGPRWGFVQFAVDMVSVPMFLAISATGIALYLRVVLPGLPAVPTALAALALSIVGATLNVRTGAAITGLFLAVELGALAIVALLGFAHPARGLGEVLLAPVRFDAAGPHSLTLGVLAIAVAAGSWATSGSGQAIYFGEELHDPARVGRLVIRITLVAIATMALPVLGLAIGSTDLPATLTAESPFAAFIAARSSPAIATLISLGIAGAIFNANMAGVICYGRWIWSSGRDRIWPAPVNRALTRLHPRFNSPWVGTLVVGLAGMACCFLGLRTLVIALAGTGLVSWLLINAAALAGRRRGLTGGPGTYRAPLYPLPQLLSFAAVAGLAVLTWQDEETGRPGELLLLGVIAAALVYHRFVLSRRPGGWQPVNPNAVQPA